MRNISRGSFALLLLALACLEPYSPPAGQDLHLLVVDGFVNSSDGLLRVKLSRSLPLDGLFSYPVEPKASVIVESEDGARFPLPEVSPGTYESHSNALRIGDAYRALIRTSAGDSFTSDFVTLKKSPPLGNVFWVPEGDGISIRVDAEDVFGTTRYYQWTYTETWEYDADRLSNFVMKNGRPTVRTPQERVNVCYLTNTSSRVLIATTRDRSSDVIRDYPLVHIKGGSRKLCRTYSILVQQRALDERSYEFWSQLQKSTENLGGLFDPLPSQVVGNIHPDVSTQPRALGYFSGGGIEEKRIYIRFEDLPPALRFVDRRPCMTDTVSTLAAYPNGSPFTLDEPATIAVVQDTNLPWSICMDCRMDGGTVTKPPFWPN